MDGNFASRMFERIRGKERVSPASATAPIPATATQFPGATTLTPAQAQWWAENRRFARQVGQDVFRIDGIGDFHGDGRRMNPNTRWSPPVVAPAPAPTTPLSPPAAAATGAYPNTGYPSATPQPGFAPQPAGPYPGTTPPPYAVVPGPPSDPNANPYEAVDPFRREQKTNKEDDSSLTETIADRLSGDSDDGLLSALPFQKSSKTNQAAARQHFAEAENAMRQSDFDMAAEKYEAAMENWPNSPLEEDAMFMLGEAYFFADEYPDALTAYEELLKKYKRSRHLEKAVAREFQIGHYWEQLHENNPKWILSPNFTDGSRPRLDTLGHARRAYSRVRLNDPTGKLADDSLMATASSFFKRGEWDSAAYHYTLLVREYPDSEHQYDAHILGIQSHMRVYQGPEYDKTPLVEAETLLKQALRQFPNQPPEQRQRLTTVQAQIKAAAAERDFSTAEFYARQGFVDSARQYHQQILADYPNTPIAARSHQRIAELQSEPGVPPQRFAWLSGVFPEERDEMSNMIRTARQPGAAPAVAPGAVRR